MKRRYLIMLIVLILLFSNISVYSSAETKTIKVGDHVLLGRLNEQDIPWTVLSVEGNRALLFCDYIIGGTGFGFIETGVREIAFSALDGWCKSFYESEHLSDTERQAILPYSDTDERTVFIFSREELLSFFSNGVGAKRSVFSGLSVVVGAFSTSWESTTTITEGKETQYWLRSMSLADESLDLATYDKDGEFGRATSAWLVYNVHRSGVCPSVYVDLSKLQNLTPVSTTLPDAVKYAPYHQSIFGSDTSTFSLKSGKLPTGLSLSSDGIISGIPTELGVFNFSVAESNGTVHSRRLSVLWQGGADVEESNEKGYGFVETSTNNGRVQNQTVSSASELKPQTMHCEASFTEFHDLYLDGQKLIRNVDYTAEDGSTRLTLSDKTLSQAGSGVHVLAAEFHTKSSNGELEIKYTTQKYTIIGIPGKNVNIVVKGIPVIWTDAEPYVNKDSRTMVPFRAIADALGLTVDWNSSTREAIFSDGAKTIYFQLDSKTARTSAGGSVYMDTAAISVNGRSYAPVRYLAEFFGYTVTWDGKTRTVGIS